MNQNCYSCKFYKNGFCENLDIKPCYPKDGCEDFKFKPQYECKYFNSIFDLTAFLNNNYISKNNIVKIVFDGSVYFLIYLIEVLESEE